LEGQVREVDDYNFCSFSSPEQAERRIQGKFIGGVE